MLVPFCWWFLLPRRCLSQNNWNFEKAAMAFSSLKVQSISVKFSLAQNHFSFDFLHIVFCNFTLKILQPQLTRWASSLHFDQKIMNKNWSEIIAKMSQSQPWNSIKSQLNTIVYRWRNSVDLIARRRLAVCSRNVMIHIRSDHIVRHTSALLF